MQATPTICHPRTVDMPSVTKEADIVIVAAGKIERMGGKADKAFLSLGPKPVLAYSLMTLDGNTEVDDIVLVLRKEQLLAAQGLV